jgi:hypothetical protein
LYNRFSVKFSDENHSAICIYQNKWGTVVVCALKSWMTNKIWPKCESGWFDACRIGIILLGHLLIPCQTCSKNVLGKAKISLPYTHSFHWHVQKMSVPCRSRELLPFLSVILFPATLPHKLFFHSSLLYFFLPPFSTNYSSIVPHFIL